MKLFGKEIPSFKQRPHLYKKWVWIILTVPTLLWWSESILWVLLISIYANVVGEDGADEAMQAKQYAEEKDKKNE